MTIDTKRLRALAEKAIPDGEHGAYTFEGTRRLREFQYEVSPQTVLTLLDELEGHRHWKAEAVDVLLEWEKTWEAAGCPGRIGASKAESVRQEIGQYRDTLARILGYTRGAVRRLMPEELAELERERRSDD